MTSVLIGVDIGTSSVKVSAVDPHVGIIGEGTAFYDTHAPHPGWAEQNPEDWWTGTLTAYSDALNTARTKRDAITVCGIGVTGQMHTFVLVDRAHKPLRNAITWMDTRTRELVPEIRERLHNAGLLATVKNDPAPGLTLCPLVWLARNEPHVMERAVAILTAKDYIRMRLTGMIGADFTDASATLLLDVGARTWCDAIGTLFGIPTDMLPGLSDSWQPSGTLCREARDLISSVAPVSNSLAVAIGCGDQQAAALANGVLRPETIQIMVGTGSQIASPVDQPPANVQNGLNVFCHHTNWLVQGSVQNAGSALTWIQRTLGTGWDDYESALLKSHDREAPFFIPYLTGERSPIMDPEATGAWLRLQQTTTREELLYAGVEGVVFGIVDALEAVERSITAARSLSEIRIGGGGIRSRAYVQLICDAIGRPVGILPESNTTSLGAAILGGIATGEFESLEVGNVALGVKVIDTVLPDPDRGAQLADRRRAARKIRSVCLSETLVS